MSINKQTLENLRQEYSAKHLSEFEINDNPFHQFGTWFKEAMEVGIIEPNALTLTTISPEGKPVARVMLLKGFDENGFTFFTNYNSRKGQHISSNPNVCLSFFWLPLQRQVIIEGVANKVSRAESIRYFQSRPKTSQIGAWVSQQSKVIENRSILEDRRAELEQEYADIDILPCPEHWGGYLVKPASVEFWQGQKGRIHDRIIYTPQEDNTWKLERLAP
jgi:pyridoxamine 5'-phosphate oxidase